MTVSITGPGEIAIKDMPVGNYTIEELTDWSWRYTVDQKERTVDLNNPEVTEIVTFTNTRTEDLWLSGDSYCSNWWGGGTATDRKVVKRNKNGNGNT